GALLQLQRVRLAGVRDAAVHLLVVLLVLLLATRHGFGLLARGRLALGALLVVLQLLALREQLLEFGLLLLVGFEAAHRAARFFDRADDLRFGRQAERRAVLADEFGRQVLRRGAEVAEAAEGGVRAARQFDFEGFDRRVGHRLEGRAGDAF